MGGEINILSRLIRPKDSILGRDTENTGLGVQYLGGGCPLSETGMESLTGNNLLHLIFVGTKIVLPWEGENAPLHCFITGIIACIMLLPVA